MKHNHKLIINEILATYFGNYIYVYDCKFKKFYERKYRNILCYSINYNVILEIVLCI